MSDLVPQEGSSSVSTTSGIRGDLDRFETVVQGQLAAVGLPTDLVFNAVSERHMMLSNIAGVLSELPEAIREQSLYISKMIAATSVGLFDAALNYLWDELVNELRRRVVGFDLKYFYDIAAGTTDLRRHLRTEDDLSRIDDASLLRAAKEIGLLTDVGFQKLDHIRFMRNHASAAHPNQVSLSGLELATWLQVCIREVIMTPPDKVTAHTGRLLANIKKERLSDEEVRDAAIFFDQLPRDRADTLANGFFGLYLDSDRSPVVGDNVRKLWPKLWPFVGEDARRTFGLRHARARASAESDHATAARELIDLAGATAYLTEEVRTVELDVALDALDAAHRGKDNFFNEEEPAKRLDELVGLQGTIPEILQKKYIRLLVEVFLGNGYGVSFSAVPVYQSLLERMDGKLAGMALRSFLELEISTLLWNKSAERQWRNLLEYIEPKLTSTLDRDLFQLVHQFSGAPSQLASDSRIKRAANKRVSS